MTTGEGRWTPVEPLGRPDEPGTWTAAWETEAETALRAEARRAAWELLEPARRAGGAHPCAPLLRRLGERRLLAVAAAEAYGGRGLGLAAAAVVAEELGRVFPSAAALASVSAIFAGKPLERFGSPELRRQWLPGIVDGSQVAALALSEPQAGSDVSALATVARKEGNGWVLDGVKWYITGGLECDLFVLYAVSTPEAPPARRFTAFLVPRTAPGLSLQEMTGAVGMQELSLSAVTLEAVRVDDGMRIGDVGQAQEIMLSGLATERVDIAARALGAATRAFEEARAYAAGRVQFGRPIDSFQTVAHQLADMRVTLDAGRLLLLRAARYHDHLVASGVAQPTKECLEEVAIAKLYCAERGYRVCDQAMQIFAAAGMVGSSVVATMLRDARVFRIGGGTDEIQRHIIHREERQRYRRST